MNERYRSFDSVDEAVKDLANKLSGLYCRCGDKIETGGMLHHWRLKHPNGRIESEEQQLKEGR